MIKEPGRRLPGATLLAVPLAALLLSCSAPSDTGTDRAAGGTPAPAAASASASASAAEPAGPVEKVRDAFATLQATYHSGCTATTARGEVSTS